MAHRWQQQNSANEWIDDQGIKNGGHRTGGNQMQYTKDSFTANKLNKFMGEHRPTKETQLQALTQMLSQDQN